MKKLALIFAFVVSVFAGFSQNMIDFTLQSAITDTLWVQENQIIKVTKTSTGSALKYFDGKGDISYADVRERSADTANVASSIAIIFSGSAGSIDSITINGVNIIANPVAFNTNITTTVADIEDSIDAQTQSPVNFAAANADSTLTISAPAAFGDTANGYEVVIYTTTLTSSAPSTMSGGFTVVRNLLTLTDRMFNVTVSSVTTCISADRVREIKENSSGLGSIWYDDPKNRVIDTSNQPDAIRDLINAL